MAATRVEEVHSMPVLGGKASKRGIVRPVCSNSDSSTRGHLEGPNGNCQDCDAEKPARGGWSHACPKGDCRRSFKGG